MEASTSRTWRGDFRTLRALARRVPGSLDAPARLRAFYEPQARDYDGFRERLLHGRRRLIEALPFPAGGVWIDLGGGTGRNLEFAGERLDTLSQVYVVDLASPLLAQARARAAARGWRNVTLLEADVSALQLPEGCADVVTLSYSLTMMTDWLSAVEVAARLLKPGGLIGVVDFYVSRPGAAPLRQHRMFSRHFWPAWFRRSHVWLNPEHLPYLTHRFTGVMIEERLGSVPYMAGLRVPHYIFIGRR